MSTRVLFVCLGNICRSPMAEFVLRDLVQKANLSEQITVASAGTSGWHNGESMHSNTQQMLLAHQILIDPTDFHSSQVQPEDLQHYNHIIAMDNQNLTALKQIFQQLPSSKVYKITDLIPECGLTEVPDPYFTGDFGQTYELVQQGCTAWLHKWQQQHQ